MKLAIYSASVPSFSPAELVRHALDAGYRGVEWRVADVSALDPQRGWHAKHNNRCTIAPSLQAVREIARLCERAGLHIVGLSPYIPVGDVAFARHCIALAAQAGGCRVRLWAPAPGVVSYAEAFKQMREFIDAIVPFARQQGVSLALEQHQNTICASVSLAMRLAEHYAPEDLRVIYDIGNLGIEGYEDPRIALDLMGQHLAHVQLKNVALTPRGKGLGWSWAWCPMDEGVMALPHFLHLLVARRFDDWLSVEDFSSQSSDVDKLRQNHALVEHWLAQPAAAENIPA